MIKSRLLPLQTIARQSYNIQTRLSSTTDTTDNEKEKELERIAIEASIDEPPTACCQSGCANCVFIVWAEAITAKMKDAGPEVSQKILDMVEDPSMKAYLELELRCRGLKKVQFKDMCHVHERSLHEAHINPFITLVLSPKKPYP